MAGKGGITHLSDSRRQAVKKYLRLAAVLCVSVAMLWLAWRQIPLSELLSDLGRVSSGPLVLAILFLVATLWTKIERWQVLLEKQGKLPRKSLWSALLVGYLGNVVLPGRLGEFARAYLLSERCSIRVLPVLSTIAIEKTLDIGVLLLFLTVLGLVVPLPGWASYAGTIGALTFGTVCVTLALVVIWGKRLQDSTDNGSHTAPSWLARRRWWIWLREFVISFGILRSPHVATRAILWSLLSWLFGGLVNLCVLWSVGITPLVPASVLTLVATNLGMALPSAPGYIGVHHFLSTIAVEAFGVPHDTAFTYAVLVHALIFGTFAFLGSIALLATGTSLGKISSAMSMPGGSSKAS